MMNDFERSRADGVYTILRELGERPQGLSSLTRRTGFHRGFIDGVLEGATKDGYTRRLGKKYTLTPVGQDAVDSYSSSIDYIVGD
jgi:predicted transcriptional regulator